MQYLLSLSARIALLLALVIATVTASAEFEAERFFGLYEGQAISDRQGEITNRDQTVDISPHKKGFMVNWVSVSRKPNGEIKRKNYNIEFTPTRRSHIYQAGMRTNIFGRRKPLDPMHGDPYVWARIEGPVLNVYALHVLEDGGYEMQIYKRTLTAQGLDIKYSRLRDGKLLRSVNGSLKKLPPE